MVNIFYIKNVVHRVNGLTGDYRELLFKEALQGKNDSRPFFINYTE